MKTRGRVESENQLFGERAEKGHHKVIQHAKASDAKTTPKHYDFKTVESDMQAFWREAAIYKFDDSSDKPLYAIDTPPPTVSGSLHIGHIFSYTQAEMIARYKRMQGYNVFYPFGFDDNGLPTERLVERENGILAKELPREVFIEKCIQTTSKYEAAFRALWQTLGFSVDWSLQYETISPRAQSISQKSFIALYKAGKAYLKQSPVLWCPLCQTSIAQAELEVATRETTFNDIAFKVDGEVLAVATTRPELLFGCVCLFVHPEDSRYQHLIGKRARVPLYDYDIPIMADDDVEREKGTGVVMCATFGDSTDVMWYDRYQLPYRAVMTFEGTIDRAVPIIGGMPVLEARQQVLKALAEAGLLLSSKTIEHAIAIHERCGHDTEILPSRQWYIDILSNKQRYLEAADEINWYPAHMKHRYLTWVENLKWDWCISRQRYFGVPFPVWYCQNCGAVMLAEEAKLPVNPMESKPDKPCTCGCTTFEPEMGVFDTWATSSMTPFINAKWGEAEDRTEQLMPMALRTQAHEIIRTWAFYTIVKSLYHTNRIPWKDIMISGFVLAKKGEKMSKSKQNAAMAPDALIKTHSADVIRYWAASAKLGTDTFFDLDELKGARKFITKLWHATKFAAQHLEDYNGELPETLLPIDRWIIEKCRLTVNQAKSQLDVYEVGAARLALDGFFWHNLCDDYLEIVKERLYQPEHRGYDARRSAQYALNDCFMNMLKCYAIYVPHITEYLYQNFFKASEQENSLHQMLWNQRETGDTAILAFGEDVQKTVSEARRYKSTNGLSLKAELALIEVKTKSEFQAWFRESESDLLACCRAGKLVFTEEV
ncbi:valine--tRNA ligase [Fusibacter paucivorans]|uniref:Valine--tRNA ligase n=2 Tax=Fusibacter paucivorans TaxID=76009 RepID=A0ABS5PRY2_9FIRM|nr:valine--tRNA ligase [Fusibacter paucivorans]